MMSSSTSPTTTVDDDGASWTITVEDFLERLDLPTQHPYLPTSEPSGDNASSSSSYTSSASFQYEEREFSMSRYFVPARPMEEMLMGDLGGLSASPSIATISACKGGDDPNNSLLMGRGCELAGQLLVSSANIHGAATRFLRAARSIFLDAWPCLSAFAMMVLRMISPFVILLYVAYLATRIINRIVHARRKGPSRLTRCHSGGWSGAGDTCYVVFTGCSLFCSALLVQDYMYVMEYGRTRLLFIHSLLSALAWICWPRQGGSDDSMERTRRGGGRRLLFLAVFVIPLTAAALHRSMNMDLEIPTIHPGFYYDASNPYIKSIVSSWPEEYRTYDDGRATPWILNGDMRTGMPFLMNTVESPDYIRRWVPTIEENEEEALILDIAFPTDGKFHKDKPLFLVLAGLNGGSSDEFVKDFVIRRTREGCTVAVIVTRGLMNSPVLGENLLHFARVADIHAAASALRLAAGPDQTIAGVGYSMGAINLSNYVAHSGADCPLNAAVAISGGLDTRLQVQYRHSADAWQPFLSRTLREIVRTKFMAQIERRMSREEIANFTAATSLLELDRTFFVKYHGFDDLDHYYSEMGAMGDFVRFDGMPGEVGRIANVSIPLCVISALDDPIGYWKTLSPDPSRLVTSGKGRVLMLLTEKGGHVGWSTGWNPRKTKWKWMSDAAGTFAYSVDTIRKAASAPVRDTKESATDTF